MNCVNCKCNNVSTFFAEIVPCAYCNGKNDVEYHACKSCGLIWKSINNKIVDHIMFTDPNLGLSLSSSMDEIIHKCLRCDKIAFEIESNLYHCSDCGFEWEVVQ